VPLLAPVAAEGSYSKLAADLARMRSRLDASLVVIDVADSVPAAGGSVGRLAALRLGGQRVLTVSRLRRSISARVSPSSDTIRLRA
jgi:hypothetical protein